MMIALPDDMDEEVTAFADRLYALSSHIEELEKGVQTMMIHPCCADTSCDDMRERKRVASLE